MTTPAFGLRNDPRGKLSLLRPGEKDVNDVRLRRVFPWSKPGQFVSIRNADGKELLLIDDPSQLPAELRGVIDMHLSSGIFIPRITRVIEVDVRFGYQQWSVETDRGAIQFRVQEREDIRFLPDGRFTVKDADGNLYELPPLEVLDEASRRAIEPLI